MTLFRPTSLTLVVAGFTGVPIGLFLTASFLGFKLLLAFAIILFLFAYDFFFGAFFFFSGTVFGSFQGLSLIRVSLFLAGLAGPPTVVFLTVKRFCFVGLLAFAMIICFKLRLPNQINSYCCQKSFRRNGFTSYPGTCHIGIDCQAQKTIAFT